MQQGVMKARAPGYGLSNVGWWSVLRSSIARAAITIRQAAVMEWACAELVLSWPENAWAIASAAKRLECYTPWHV